MADNCHHLLGGTGPQGDVICEAVTRDRSDLVTGEWAKKLW